VDTRATYQGETNRGGAKLQEIKLQPTAVAVERSATSGLGRFTLKGHEGTGSVYFDQGKGRLVEAALTQNLDMESSPPGQQEKVVLKVKLCTSAKLVGAK
jgi:hypothetical protein